MFGVDLSRRMVSEARSRSAGRPAPTFLQADAQRLPFPDATFDAVWVKRTFMHLGCPETVMAEIARVARPGGRVVAVEPDTEVALLDTGMVAVTRRLMAFRAAGYANPWAGRQLRRLMLEAGLTDVEVTVDAAEITDLAGARVIPVARVAAERGVLTEREASAWEEDLRARERRGLFACYRIGFVARGLAPG